MRIADYVTWYEMGATIVAIDRRKQARSGLAEASALLWKQLAAGASPDQLARAVAEAYSVSVDDAAALVREFAQTMADKELVFA